MRTLSKLCCHPLLVIVLPSLLVGTIPAQQRENPLQCTAVTIKFPLKARQGFQQKIGELTFKVKADTSREQSNGWTFSLDNAAGNDFVYPVNPPIRSNPSQILGPGYGLTARDSLKSDRELRFLLKDSDFELIDPLLRDALWPYSAPEPDHAADNYVRALGQVPLGILHLKTVQADISPEDFIRSARFEVDFIAPAGFHFDPALAPRRSACPPPFKF